MEKTPSSPEIGDVVRIVGQQGGDLVVLNNRWTTAVVAASDLRLLTMFPQGPEHKRVLVSDIRGEEICYGLELTPMGCQRRDEGMKLVET